MIDMHGLEKQAWAHWLNADVDTPWPAWAS
jgi:hypothetical protein